MFVLDTNVLMHDPSSLFRFEEHDVYLPMMTLEELDNHKKGMTEVARNARQVSRTLDALVSNTDDDAIENGIPLSKLGNKDAKGRLYFQTRLQTAELPVGLPSGKADNQILSVVRSLEAEQEGRAIVLVSKDINMRIKARALGLPAEDYFNDHVLEDTDLLYSGIVQLPDDFWNKHGKDLESWQENKTARARRSTASPVRSCRRCWSTSSCSSSRRMAKRRSMARSSRSTARPPCCKPCATSATTRTTCGASPRATASRTSR
jgi:PhoH-like ATPase